MYDFTLYILAGMLALGFLCNWAVKPLARQWFMTEEEVAALQPAPAPHTHAHSHGIGTGQFDAVALLAWLAVEIPIAWGVWMTLKTAFALFV